MSDCLRHAPTLLSRSFDDEFVVIDLETGTYYSLTGAAATAWELLGAGIDRAGLAEGLARVFDAEPMTVESDLDRFLDWCRSEALVVPAETPGAAIAVDGPRRPYAPPAFQKFTDMQELILLDPVHEVDEVQGWPHRPADA